MADQPNREDPDIERVKAAVDILMEHFDAVQIFTNRVDLDGADETTTVTYGRGNFLSRYGQIKQWAIKIDESVRAQSSRDDEDDE